MPAMPVEAATISLDSEHLYLYPEEVLSLTATHDGTNIRWSCDSGVTLYSNPGCTTPVELNTDTTTATVYVKAGNLAATGNIIAKHGDDLSITDSCPFNVINYTFVNVTLNLGTGHNDIAAGVKTWLDTKGALYAPSYKRKDVVANGSTVTLKVANTQQDGTTPASINNITTVVLSAAITSSTGASLLNNGSQFIGIGRNENYASLDTLSDEILGNEAGLDAQITDLQTFYALWATQIYAASVTITQPDVGASIGGDYKPTITLPAGANYSVSTDSAVWADSSYNALTPAEATTEDGSYYATVDLVPDVGYCFSSAPTITAKMSDGTAITSDKGVYAAPYGFAGCRMTVKMSGIKTPRAPRTVTFNANGGSLTDAATKTGTSITSPSDPTKSNYTFDGWWTAASGGVSIAFPYEPAADITLYAHWTYNAPPRRPSYQTASMPSTYTLSAVTTPTLIGTYQIGTDVKSKLPEDTTITLTDGSTRSVSIDWTNISKAEREEKYRGTVSLPSDVENPNSVSTSFEYTATLTGVKLTSIDAPEDHRVFAFGEEDIIPEKRPKTAVLHLADGTTCDADIEWSRTSKSRDEYKYNGIVQLPDGVVNLDNISTRVTFTATFIEKPTGHFEIDTLSTKYSYGSDLVELLDRSEGKVTYTSDDESVVTVSASRTYNLQTGQVEDEGKYVYINKVAAGKTTVRAFINGYEVDSLDVTITRAEQKISVTSNKRTTYTISAETLKKSGQSIKLKISGNKTDLRYKSSKASIKYYPSSNKLRLPKGLKKGKYTFTVTAKKTKQYEKAEASFTIKVTK